MIKITRYLVLHIIFFLFFTSTYAFDANLELDKNQADINDTIDLKVWISSDTWWQIAIKQISWIENFDIISQSQSQSSASKVVIVNWQTQTKTESKIYLDLVLKAKNKWDFEIWPATLTDWSWDVLTNTVKVNITWDNMFINNNHLKIPPSNQANNSNWLKVNSSWNTDDKKIDKKVEKDENQDKEEEYENIEKRNFDENEWLYLLWFILLMILAGVFYTFKKNPDLLEWFVGNVKKSDENIKEKEDNKTSPDKWSSLKGGGVFEEVVKVQKNIEYPDLDENDFIPKVNEVFRLKIAQKYWIDNIENKTYEEILSLVNTDDNWKLTEIISLLNKAKYSNQTWDHEKILELVTNFNN